MLKGPLGNSVITRDRNLMLTRKKNPAVSLGVLRLPVGVAGIKNLLEKLQHQKNHKHADKFWDQERNHKNSWTQSKEDLLQELGFYKRILNLRDISYVPKETL